MSKEKQTQFVERRKAESTQFQLVCNKEFKKLKKGQKKQKKTIDELTGIVKNGHSSAIARLIKQNRWIMGMISTTFFVLLAGMIGVIVR